MPENLSGAVAKNADRSHKKQRQEYAFALYAQQVKGVRLHGKQAEILARQCFHLADDFIRVQKEADVGNLDKRPVREALNDCFAPNLDRGLERGAKPNHPINIASRQYGSLNRVREIFAEIESTSDDYVHADMGWDGPTTRLAKTIFGGVIERHASYEQEAALN